MDIENIKPNELTPPPAREITIEEREKIIVLLNTWIQPREIFIDYNFPLEWATKIWDELNTVITEEILPEVIE